MVLHLPLICLLGTLSPDQTSAIDSAVHQGMSERHIPSVVVLVDRDGKREYEKAWGLRQTADKLPATLETRYEYGSLTKQFTAMGILLLAQDGKLSLDDPVGKWLPAFSKFSATIRQTLVHMGGFPDFMDAPEYVLTIAPSPFLGTDWGLDWAAAKPPVFAPGTQAVYDNTGYVILARIIEQASGLSYEQFLDDRIFVPLGMKSVEGYRMLQPRPNTAEGYLWWSKAIGDQFPEKERNVQLIQLDTMTVAPPWNMRQVDGAGFLVGEAADLQIWDNALLKGELLQGKWRDLYYTVGVMADGSPAYTGPEKTQNRAAYTYGGMAKFTVNGQTVYGANGGTLGFLTMTVTVPSQHLAVTIFTNEGQIDNSKLTTPILAALIKP
jgi:D-alanyl-D-alanine carboxypeptidase